MKFKCIVVVVVVAFEMVDMAFETAGLGPTYFNCNNMQNLDGNNLMKMASVGALQGTMWTRPSLQLSCALCSCHCYIDFFKIKFFYFHFFISFEI